MFAWIERLIGKNIAQKLNLGDNMTDAIDSKPWYKSKTVLSAIIGVLLAAVQPISTAVGHPIVIPNWVFEILAGMGLYSLRTATTTIQ